MECDGMRDHGEKMRKCPKEQQKKMRFMREVERKTKRNKRSKG
jgi:hypothetical protein